MSKKNIPKASIYQRKSDMRWVGSISAGKNQDGSRRRIPPVYGWSKSDVEEKINILLYEIQTGQYAEKTKDTFIDYLIAYHRICSGFDAWSKNPAYPQKAKWAITTSVQYKDYIDIHFKPYFKEMKLADIRVSHMDAFYNSKLTLSRKHNVKQGKNTVEKTLPPLGINTVLKFYTFANSAFEYAIINDKIKKNPNIGTVMSTMKKTKFKPEVYTVSDFSKLLRCVSGKEEEVPIVLAAGCGLRRGEICGLRWKDIDFNNCTISVENNKVTLRPGKYIEKNPKNELSRRKIKVPNYVITVLKREYDKIQNCNDEDFVITKWKPQSLTGHFNNIISENNLKKIRFHDLRHYNATIMLQNGVSNKVAAERLGHSNVSTLTDIYQHVLTDMDDKAAELIDSSISTKLKVVK